MAAMNTCVCYDTLFWMSCKNKSRNTKFWNTHTIRPVHESHCPSGKPEAVDHLPKLFNGRNYGFPLSVPSINQFNTLVMAPCSPCGDDELQHGFEDLQRQSELALPVNWTMAVEQRYSTGGPRSGSGPERSPVWTQSHS